MWTMQPSAHVVPSKNAIFTASSTDCLPSLGGNTSKLMLTNIPHRNLSPALCLSLTKKRCLRCGGLFSDEENGPKACSYHGHMTGDRGLFAIAPPHQGIDGEWTDESGIIVYKWKDREQRRNTGQKNWKSRWTCCGEYEEDAPPCKKGRHVSYDDGATLF